MNLIKRYFSIAIACLLVTSYSNETSAVEIKSSDWVYSQETSFSKAFTKNETNSEFGVVCADKCMFYINSGSPCLNSKTYLVMLTTENQSISLKMTCVIQNENYFQILDPFEVVLKSLKTGNNIGLTTALDNGVISASFFSLNGAFKAVTKAAEIAKTNKYPTPKEQ